MTSEEDSGAMGELSVGGPRPPAPAAPAPTAEPAPFLPPAPAEPAPAEPAPAEPAHAPAPERAIFNRAHFRPTVLVAAVVAFVVIGGLALDGVIPAPSAGTQVIGGDVSITASSGWVLVSIGADRSQGIALQKGDATLTAQVLGQGFAGSSSELMSEVRHDLESQVAQISYGDAHETTISGNDSTYVLFEAILSGPGDGTQTGTVDGELVCMVVSGNAVVLEVAAPQGDLQFATDDVAKMVKTVRAAR